jgi:hypothetical protein
MQEQRDDGGRPHVRGVHVAEPELHAILDARLLCVDARDLEERRIDLDAHAVCAELPCRGDGNAPIPGPQVEHDVVRTDFGQLEHGSDHRHRRGLVADVPPRDRVTAQRQHQQGDGDLAESRRHLLIVTGMQG